MKERLKVLLAEYGTVITKEGWASGEPLIEKYEKEIPDFRRWAHAMGIMLRAQEILEEES